MGQGMKSLGGIIRAAALIVIPKDRKRTPQRERSDLLRQLEFLLSAAASDGERSVGGQGETRDPSPLASYDLPSPLPYTGAGSGRNKQSFGLPLVSASLLVLCTSALARHRINAFYCRASAR